MVSKKNQVKASAATLDAKVAFLRRPASYAERPERIEAIETHMSWVFLAGEHAYKLKKPVRHDFLDFSTTELRRADCEEEVRLNRRLAPDVYLGVAALTTAKDGSLALAGTGPAVDWLVKMHRLPREHMLDRALANGTATAEDLTRIGERLGRFYRSAPPAALPAPGLRGRLERDIAGCAAEIERAEYALDGHRVHGLADRMLAFVDREATLIALREQAGKVVEGHGDLRPEHVCLLHEPAIIDCVEFNRGFRIVDAAEDLAFLALECERLGHPDAGGAILAAYSQAAADTIPARLLDFYFAVRAFIRAKIAAWRTHDGSGAERERWLERAEQYLALAERHLARAG
jgi:aminoglycoside phosphotransferase family enzyme